MMFSECDNNMFGESCEPCSDCSKTLKHEPLEMGNVCPMWRDVEIHKMNYEPSYIFQNVTTIHLGRVVSHAQNTVRQSHVTEIQGPAGMGSV